MVEIIIKINIDHEGWITALRSTQKEPIENAIRWIMAYEEYVETKISYEKDNKEYPIIEFNNRKNLRGFYLQDLYRIVAKNPQI